MRRVLVCAVTAVLLGVPLAAEAVPRIPGVGCGVPPGSERCERWAARQAGGRGEAVVAGGGRVYATGAATVAYDETTGARLWSSPTGGGRSIALSRDGSSVYVTGVNAARDYVTVAYDAATGAQRWLRTYDGTAHGSDEANAVAVSDDGRRVVVTGFSDSGASALDMVTVLYDALSGTQVWLGRYDGPARFWDVGTAVATSGSRVYVTGRSNGAGRENYETDAATVAYDLGSGAQLWVARYDHSYHGREYPYAIGVSPDGRTVFVAGESQSGLGEINDYVTLAYDAGSGASRWAARYDGPAHADDRALTLAVSPRADSVYVSGFSVDGSVAYDRSIVTVAYAVADGATRWVARHKDPLGGAATSVAVSPDGARVYMTGVQGGWVFGVGAQGVYPHAAVNGVVTVGYEAASGRAAWVAHFDDPGMGRDVTVSPASGRVFVTGGGSEMVTLGYDV